MLETFMQILGIKKASLLAGFIGGVLSLRFLPDVKTPPQRVITALGGSAAAVYLAPLVVTYLGVSGGAETGIAFAIGLFGMSLISACMKTIADLNLSQILKNRIGG